MKLYILYEQTCDGDWNHRYFKSEDKANGELYEEERECREKDFVSYWKVTEAETED